MDQKEKSLRNLLKKVSERDDHRAFHEFYKIYFNKIYRVAFSLVKNREMAEEIVEDVFFNFWQIRDRYLEIRNVDNYLFISTKNLSFHYLKKEQKLLKVAVEDFSRIQVSHQSPEKLMLTNELETFLDQAVERLPDRCKEIFKLARMKGLKYKEVAKLLNISVKTVENQIAIALKKLYAELDTYYSAAENPVTLRKIS